MRDQWRGLEKYLRGFAAKLDERPRAILVVSAHWQEAHPTVNAGTTPPLLYDYGGFPPHTYRLTWDAPGAPDLAARVLEVLSTAGIQSAVNASRGWDHGVFVPLKIMFPDANIPTVQLSLQQGLDPAAHLEIGRALRPFRKDGILIIGSGQTYHNMRGAGADTAAEAFDTWLREAMTDGETRDDALIGWESAPGAREAQPYEDHLLPLMVVAGAASREAGQTHFHDYAFGRPISGFRFG